MCLRSQRIYYLGPRKRSSNSSQASWRNRGVRFNSVHVVNKLHTYTCTIQGTKTYYLFKNHITPYLKFSQKTVGKFPHFIKIFVFPNTLSNNLISKIFNFGWGWLIKFLDSYFYVLFVPLVEHTLRFYKYFYEYLFFRRKIKFYQKISVPFACDSFIVFYS